MYRTGTVSIAQGSKTLTGSGTQWLTVANILAGYLITFDESRFYEITSVGSDTSLQLESLIDGLGYQGESLTNAKYVITFPLQSGIASNIALNQLKLQEKWQQRERDISGWMSTDATTHLVESYTGNKVSIISLQELTRLINAGQYPGANAWLDGNGAPDNSIGGDGAFYLDTSTGDIYRKGSAEWSLLMTIAGGSGSGGGLTESEVLAITHPSLSANILNTLVTLNQGVASLGQADAAHTQADEEQSQALTDAITSLTQSYQQADSQLESSFQQSISDSTTNITIDQLSPGLSAPIERIDIGGEIDIALAQITSDIESIEVDGLDVSKAIDNKTLGTSVSVVNSQVDIIKQYMDGALTNAELFDTSESVAVAQQKISTLATTTEAQALLSSQLSVRTGSVEDNIAAQAERITLVETSANGNKSAIEAVELTVGDVDNPESVVRRLSKVEGDSQGNLNAIDALELAVGDANNPDSVVRRLSKVESDSQGNAQAIDVVEAAVNDPDTGIAAAFTELQAVNNSISGIQATARFGIDVNGNFTGVTVNGSTVSNTFTIAAQNFNIYDSALGANALSYSGGRLQIDADGVFGGKLRSPKIELIGTNIMEITDPDGFGPHNLYFWGGARILDGNGDPDFSQLTKSNAMEWKDLSGNRYYGGSLSAGVLRNAARSSTKNLNPSVEIGPFGTNGNSKQIIVSFSMQANRTSYDTCLASYLQPSVTAKLERSTNGSTWIELQTFTFNGSTTAFYISELNECRSSETIDASYTHTDNDSATNDFYYRVTTSGQQRFHQTSEVSMQELAIVITEE